MANPPKQESSPGGFLKALTSGQNHQRQLEQTVVAWQDDETVTQCPFCQYPPFMKTKSNTETTIQFFQPETPLSVMWASGMWQPNDELLHKCGSQCFWRYFLCTR